MRSMLLTIMLLGVTGVFLLFWLSPPEAFLKKPVSDTAELPKADSYMLNIDKLDFNEKGAKAYHLDATEARHFKRGNVLELDQPNMVVFNESKGSYPWNMTAEKGTIYNNGARAVFTGDVYAWQNTESNIKNELRTDRLVLFPDKHIAETKNHVTIITPKGKTTGVGMWADLNSERFKLLSKVKGVHRAL
ncbi:hypothetical protein LCGC14_2535530 [marine sediment metagenome]|uniref:Lipopolysaccharide export system protein LptC n=1 Tax=marine sediment metagenome TaxID=412755 RepID=A0A0F9D3T8_9ZZZZ